MPFARVADAELYYEAIGEGPPLVLTPGGVQNGLEVIRSLAGSLAVGRRVIAYDRRFAGRSRSPLVVQTWDLAVDDLIGLLDQLGIESADLGGGATGAAISLRAAARYPARVRRVFASNVNGGRICTAFLMMAFIKSLEIAETKGIPALLEAYHPGDRYAPFVPPLARTDPTFRIGFAAMDPRDFAEVMRRTIAALFEGEYVAIALTESLLRSIEAPCLLLHGAGDDIHPRQVAERVGALIPDVRWSGVASFRRPENLAIFARDVLAFLDGGSLDGTTPIERARHAR